MIRIIDILICLFFILVFVVPQSFIILKLPIVVFLLSFIAFKLVMGSLLIYSIDVLGYYFSIIVLSVIWIIIGALNDNSMIALIGAFNLFVIYSVFYLLLVIYLSNRSFYNAVLPVVSFSAILIAFFIFIVLIEAMYDYVVIPVYMKEQLGLGVGLHDGYTHIVSRNVTSYSFIIPFLLSYVIVEKRKINRYVYVVLYLSLLALVLSSRRMIVLVVLAVPLLCVIFNLIVTHKFDQKLVYKVLFLYLTILSMFFVFFVFGNYLDLMSISGLYDRFVEVFSYDGTSPRQLQFTSLLNGFLEYPLMGSGFGGEANYVRSEELPWAYELTYVKLLFNAGVIGTLLIIILFCVYFYKAVVACRYNNVNYAINFSLLISFVCLLIMYASNPYINFDLLFVWGVLPLIILKSKKEKSQMLRGERCQ